MLGLKAAARKRPRDEAEKPFWISFSDLMTALMVLFLVAMAVALMAVTQRLATTDDQKAKMEAAKAAHDKDVESCMGGIQSVTERSDFSGVKVSDRTIDFGSLAEFAKDGHDLDAKQKRFLRSFMPLVLDVARTRSCEKWLKRVVVEGFASQEGSYLYNLNLSFKRSQRFLCVLLDSKAENVLTLDDRKMIRKIFLVSGSSFNSSQRTPEQSRRVELRLEFRDFDKQDNEVPPEIPWDEDSKCPSDS